MEKLEKFKQLGFDFDNNGNIILSNDHSNGDISAIANELLNELFKLKTKCSTKKLQRVLRK